MSNPTGAMAGWYTPATTGAEAAPPIFAMLPVAMKKRGARTIRAAVYNTARWMRRMLSGGRSAQISFVPQNESGKMPGW